MNSLEIFLKNYRISVFLKIRPVGACGRMNRQRERDMTKLEDAFLNFANAPKNDPLRTKIKIKSYVEFQTEIFLNF